MVEKNTPTIKYIILRNLIILGLLTISLLVLKQAIDSLYKHKIQDTAITVTRYIQKNKEEGWQLPTPNQNYFIVKTKESNQKLPPKPKNTLQRLVPIQKLYKLDYRKESIGTPESFDSNGQPLYDQDVGQILAFRANAWETQFINLAGIRGVTDRTSIQQRENENTKFIYLFLIILQISALIITTIQLKFREN